MTVLSDAPSQQSAGPPTERVVVVTGELGVATLPRVRAELDEAQRARPSSLVVDLSGCTFVDAASLAVLLDAHRTACRTGGELVLRGCSPRVLRLLSLTGLRRVFRLAEDAG